jgi:hypothetical protein|tara:strand:- start:3606 stop:4121 length:516 start_codon:yes stop_codon:yes gene_type:complete
MNISNTQIGPWMSEKEINFLSSFLEPSDIMLEWGCGGSTLKFSQNVKEYYSIEHNKDWYNKIKNILSPKENIFMHYVPNDLPRKLVYGPSKYEEFVTYIKHVSTLNTRFNKVLIDGRGRQWCAEEVLPFLAPDAIVFLHDFGKPDRARYNSVLNFYSKIAQADTLIALKAK